MKKGEIHEGIVEKCTFPSKGIVTVEGRPVAVKDALPGQRVRFVVNRFKSGRAEGRLLEVLEPSPLENRESACPHFGICGGCVFQTLPYEEQLKLKERQVRELLEPLLPGQEKTLMEPILASPRVFGYRNKMEYSFGDEVKGGKLAVGLHRKGSFYDIVTVDGCRIADRDFSAILTATCGYFTEANVPFYHKQSHEGYLRYLLVRKAARTGEILVSLVTSSQTEGLPGEETEREILTGWAERLLALSPEGKFAGILHTVNDSVADVIRNDSTEILYGQDFFYEELLGLRFRISPFSFFQTNSAGAEVLYEKVREYVGGTDGKVVFDLYSGTGTIAQVLAPVAKQVVGVEIVEEAVAAARANACANGLANCRFIAGDVLKVLDELPENPDIIVLDPPRDGVHPKALPKIIRYGVERIVYISCKPTSLARDLVTLQAGGYRVERVCAVDMFPGTGNVETVVLLSKGKIDSKKVRVEFSMEDMDTSGLQRGATYEQIKTYVKEQTGLSVSSLYIAQVKQKCGIIERENYNKPKLADTKQPQCPPEKEKAIRAALEHFGMV